LELTIQKKQDKEVPAKRSAPRKKRDDFIVDDDEESDFGEGDNEYMQDVNVQDASISEDSTEHGKGFQKEPQLEVGTKKTTRTRTRVSRNSAESGSEYGDKRAKSTKKTPANKQTTRKRQRNRDSDSEDYMDGSDEDFGVKPKKARTRTRESTRSKSNTTELAPMNRTEVTPIERSTPADIPLPSTLPQQKTSKPTNCSSAFMERAKEGVSPNTFLETENHEAGPSTFCAPKRGDTKSPKENPESKIIVGVTNALKTTPLARPSDPLLASVQRSVYSCYFF
jgi:hypothetical protein